MSPTPIAIERSTQTHGLVRISETGEYDAAREDQRHTKGIISCSRYLTTMGSRLPVVVWFEMSHLRWKWKKLYTKFDQLSFPPDNLLETSN